MKHLVCFSLQMYFLLHSEIEKILITDNLIENLTYPLIQPQLIKEAKNRGYL